MSITFTDLHIHSEYSLKDGMIRIAHYTDPKKIPVDIILNAQRRNTGAVTATDHGNMYGQALLASTAKNFGLKHIPACEFYIAVGSRHDKSIPKGETVYRHLCGWAKNRNGYRNMCILQKLSYTEGFYYHPRIDKELLDRYGDDIMWSDGCLSGTLSGLIVEGKYLEAYSEFMWYLDRFKDDFYIEYQSHGIQIEDDATNIKKEWANQHGVPIIATTDSHYYKKEYATAHKTLLSIQYGNWLDNPLFIGFSGDGYHLLDEDELIARYPVEYLNNTQLIVDKVEGNIVEFGDIRPPKFIIPQWFTEMEEQI